VDRVKVGVEGRHAGVCVPAGEVHARGRSVGRAGVLDVEVRMLWGGQREYEVEVETPSVRREGGEVQASTEQTSRHR